MDDIKYHKILLILQEKKRLKDLLKSLSDANSGLIENMDILSINLLKEMSNFKKDDLSSLFAKTSEKLNIYRVEIECLECGEVFWSTLRKTYILENLKKIIKNKGFCFQCKKIQEQKLREEKTQKEQRDNKEIEINTTFYIDNYLNHNKVWGKEIDWRYKISQITKRGIYDNKIKKYIQSIPYKDFLNTPYWSAIRYIILYKNRFKCELCGSNIELNVHHKNYDRHGLEHLYYKEDLIALCHACHEKHHEKKGIPNASV